MKHLRAVTDDEVTDESVKDLFAKFHQNLGWVPELHRVLALRPPVLMGRMAIRNAVGDGATTLGRRREELIEFYVANRGHCSGCIVQHGELLRKQMNTDVDTVIAIGQGQRSQLDAGERAILDFADKMYDSHENISGDDFTRLRQAGFSDENILDIVAAVAYRIFSNKLNVTLGHDDPADWKVETQFDRRLLEFAGCSL